MQTALLAKAFPFSSAQGRAYLPSSFPPSINKRWRKKNRGMWAPSAHIHLFFAVFLPALERPQVGVVTNEVAE
jgi:hypothetical protein